MKYTICQGNGKVNASCWIDGINYIAQISSGGIKLTLFNINSYRSRIIISSKTSSIPESTSECHLRNTGKIHVKGSGECRRSEIELKHVIKTRRSEIKLWHIKQ